MTGPLLRSLAIHVIIVLACGCAARKPVHIAPVDPLIKEAQEYVSAVSAKMPLWDADTHYEIYERTEIATVRADIEVAKLATTEVKFLEDVSKLHDDFDRLIALDDLLRHISLT